MIVDRPLGTRVAGGPLFTGFRIKPHSLGATMLLVAIYVLLAAPVVLAGVTPVVLAATVLLGAALASLSVIDLRHMRLPDALTLPLLGLGLGYAWLTGPELLLWHGFGAVAGYAGLLGVAEVYRRWRGRDGLGRGDAKLLAAGGAWVGAGGLASIVLLAALTALLGVAAMAAAGTALDRHSRIPFGPFLALGIWVVWLWGPLV